MKVQKKAIDITRTGVVETQAFTIKASGKAFQILSSGLYSDKILAIVRELSSNAYDAHVDAENQDTPFTVHLPNNLEPWFSIHDYGVGLSHKDVMTMYSTYFDSTKTDTNDATGMLGLGSKSPFSYTESFTVTSYFNGEQRTYLVDLGEEGVPQISLAAGFPIDTDQHNGLEIQFAVKNGDFREFENKAHQVYKRYSPLPEVVGVPNFEIEPVKYLFTGKNWRLIKTTQTGGYAKCYVIQGTVAYPVDLGAMRNIDHDSYDVLFGLNLEMDFPIGELDVAANRETLSYDERTVANLVKRADIAKKEIGKEISAQFKGCKSLWEARKMWIEVFGGDSMYSYSRESNILLRLIENIGLEINWRGQKIEPKVRINMTDDLSINGFNVQNLRSRHCGRVKMRRYTNGMKNNYINIVASDAVLFFMDDLEKGAVARVRHFVDEMDEDIKEVYLVHCKTGEATKKFTALLGGANLRNASTLPKPTRKGSSGANGNQLNGCIFIMPLNDYNTVTTNKDFWESTTLDYKAGGYYLPVNRSKIQIDGQHFGNNLYDIMKLAKELKIFDYNTTDLFGIPKSAVHKLRGTWINLFDHIAAEVKKIIDADGTADMMAMNYALTNFQCRVRHPERVQNAMINLKDLVTSEDSLIHKLADSLEAAKGNHEYDNLKALCRELEITIDLKTKGEQINLVAMLDKIYENYPMLKWPFDTYNDMAGTSLQEVADYVNMVDETSEKVLDSK